MSEKHENENLRDFLEILDNIKKSDPKEIVLPKTKQEPKGFFSRIFGNGKLCTEDEKEIIYENIHIEGYTSIAEFLQKLQYVVNYIYNKSWEITKKYVKYKKRIKNKFELIPYIDTCGCLAFCIGYFIKKRDYENKFYFWASQELIIDLKVFPTFQHGDKGIYDLIKKDVFELFPILKVFIEFLSECKDIYIDGKTCLKICFENENDVFRNENPTIKLEVLDLGMVEYVLLGEKIDCLSYANDVEILKKLRQEEKKLLYSCYLSNELDVVKLLNSIDFEKIMV